MQPRTQMPRPSYWHFCSNRMMSTGESGRIQCSPTAAACMLSNGIVLHGLHLEPRGEVDVKGKGKLRTSWLQRPTSAPFDGQAAPNNSPKVSEVTPETLPSGSDAPRASVDESSTDVAIAVDRVRPSASPGDGPIIARLPLRDRSVRDHEPPTAAEYADASRARSEAVATASSSAAPPPHPLRGKLRHSRRISPPELRATSPSVPPGSLLTPDLTVPRGVPRAIPQGPLPCTRIPASSEAEVMPAKVSVPPAPRSSVSHQSRMQICPNPHAPRELARFHERFGQPLGLSIALPPMVELETVGATDSPLAGGTPVAYEPGAVRAMRSSLGGIPRVPSMISGPVDPTRYGVVRAPSLHAGSPIARKFDGRTLLQRGAQLDAEHRAAALFVGGRTRLGGAPNVGVLWRHDEDTTAGDGPSLPEERLDLNAELQSTPTVIESGRLRGMGSSPSPAASPGALQSPPAVQAAAPWPLSSSPHENSETVRTLTEGAPHAVLDGLQRPWHGIIAMEPTTVEHRIANSRAALVIRASAGGVRRGVAVHRDVSLEDNRQDAAASDRMSASGTVLTAADADNRRDLPGLRSPPDKISVVDAPLSSSPTASTKGGLLSAALARASVSVRTRSSTPSNKQTELATGVVTSATVATPALLEPATAGTAEPPPDAFAPENPPVVVTVQPPPVQRPSIAAAVSSFSLVGWVAHLSPLPFADPSCEETMVAALSRSLSINSTMYLLAVLVGFIGINALYFLAAIASVIHIAIVIPSTVVTACAVFVAWRSGVAAQSPDRYGHARLWVVASLITLVYAFEVLNFVTFNIPDAPRAAREELLLWCALWLSLSGTSVSVTRIPFVQALVFGIVSSVFDLAFVITEGIILDLSPDVPAIAFAHLVLFRALFVWSSHTYESGERDVYAVQCAIGAAETDANSLLRNLFPAPIVASLTQGSPVPPPQISRDAAILYADLAGFTRISSGMVSVEQDSPGPRRLHDTYASLADLC